MAMRRVSPLERFSIARYELGLISNGAFSTAGRSDAPVIVGVGLRGPQLGDEALLRAVRIAVSQVVREHAALGARFVGPDEASLEWTRLPSIDLERAVTLGPVFASDGELEKFLSVEHGRAFETDKPLPLWRGVLVPRPDDILVLFSFHHGCMDGLAGIAFHISLLRALNNPPAEPIDLRAAPTSEAPLPPSVESEMDVRPSLSLTAKVVLAGLVLPTRVSEAFGLLVRGFVGVKSDGPAWTRKTPTRAVTASLDPDVGHRLAMVCRSHGVSVTAIMTAALGAVIVEHFSGRGVTARVKADLAVALRSAFATPVGPDVITNSAGGVTAPQPRWSIEPHAVEVSLEEILFEARAVSAALKADTMRVEAAKASVGLLGLISGSVSDWLARKAASAEPTSTTYGARALTSGNELTSGRGLQPWRRPGRAGRAQSALVGQRRRRVQSLQRSDPVVHRSQLRLDPRSTADHPQLHHAAMRRRRREGGARAPDAATRGDRGAESIARSLESVDVVIRSSPQSSNPLHHSCRSPTSIGCCNVAARRAPLPGSTRRVGER